MWNVTDARNASMQSPRCRGIVEILHDHGQILHRERDRRAHQDQLDQRQHQSQRERR